MFKAQHSSEEPADPAIPVTVLRSCIFLAALTESEGFPADPNYRIQVRRFIHLYWLTQVRLTLHF